MIRTAFRRLAGALLLAAGTAGAAFAVPTEITVRVLSRDAKFIGSSMGSVEVTIADEASGEVLAEGLTRGGTGDTARIMHQPRKRGEGIAIGDAAAFHAVVDLEQPRRLRVTARGPGGHPDSANTVSASQWVLPGRHLKGDGWVLEMPGLVVNLHDLPERASAGGVAVRASVQMMCGCPLTPGGLWDSNDFEVEVDALQDGEVRSTAPLEFAGEASEFAGRVELPGPGEWRLRVRAWQPATGNAGVGEGTLEVGQ